MPYLILLAPASNRVYAGGADRLSAAELAILLGADAAPAIEPVTLAGVPYLSLDLPELTEPAQQVLARLSARYAVFEQAGDDLLRPVAIPSLDRFDDDLVTIPKYPGKTNEQFTRLLVNVTAASTTRAADRPLTLLDPLAGRGTTLSTGLILGLDVAGVEADTKALEAYAAFLRTYLRRHRLKHRADLHPVRREGRSLGRRLDVEVTAPHGEPRPQQLTVFTGDTRQSAALYGKRRFDLVVTDAPYGVAHGGATAAAGLLAEALPVWAGQLKRGGALGLSWNTLSLARERLVALAAEAGLRPMDEGPYRQLSHRVDASIVRDVLVAVKD